MNVESLEFWQKVKEEYKPKRAIDICFTSPTFCKAWSKPHSHSEKCILKLADQFINDKRLDITICFSDLFNLYKNYYDEKKLRVNFINYCIAKYSAP